MADSANGPDKLEPNEYDFPVNVSLPLTHSSTLDAGRSTDESDAFFFTTPDMRPVKITYNTAPDPFPIGLYAEDLNGDFLAETPGKGQPSGVLIFVPNPAGNVVDLSCGGGFGAYSLNIEQVDAHYIQGSIEDSIGDPFLDAGVYIPELGLLQRPDVDNPDVFRLGPVEPGTYTLVCYAVNHTVAPAAAVEITVVDSDVTQDFVLTYAYSDIGEPDNNKAEARTLLDGVALSGNLDMVNPVDGDDDADWFVFTAGGPGLCTFHADIEQGWFGFQSLILHDPTDNSFFTFSSGGEDQLDCAVYLPAAGEYSLRLAGSDYAYSVQADVP
jgi:hypothetical protein